MLARGGTAPETPFKKMATALEAAAPCHEGSSLSSPSLFDLSPVESRVSERVQRDDN